MPLGPLGSQSTGAALDNLAEVYRGSDFVRDYRWLIENLPVDITGATGAVEMRRNGVAIFTPAFTVIDGPDGRFQISMTAATTGAQTPVIPTNTITICSPLDFEFQDKFEALNFSVNLTLAGSTYQLVRGFAKFYA